MIFFSLHFSPICLICWLSPNIIKFTKYNVYANYPYPCTSKNRICFVICFAIYMRYILKLGTRVLAVFVFFCVYEKHEHKKKTNTANTYIVYSFLFPTLPKDCLSSRHRLESQNIFSVACTHINSKTSCSSLKIVIKERKVENTQKKKVK